MIQTTCQECGRPALARVLSTGPGAFLHVDRGMGRGHAAVPDEAAKGLWDALEVAARRLPFNASPRLVNVDTKGKL